MKFSKKIVTESLDHPNSGIKVYTEGKRQSVILSEEQFERLISTVNESKEKEIANLIKESHKLIRNSIINESLGLNYDNYLEIIVEQGQYDRNPGIAAAEGLENVLDGIKKAYDMIKDSDTRKKLANSITKLGNFMTYTAELVGSGSSQRNPRSYDQVSKPIPHPEFEELEESEDEIEEDVKPDFLDLDGDGNKKESMKKASKDMKKEETIIASNVDDPSEEVVLQEDIRKMKQIIKPIEKV